MHFFQLDRGFFSRNCVISHIWIQIRYFVPKTYDLNQNFGVIKVISEAKLPKYIYNLIYPTPSPHYKGIILAEKE